MTNGSTIQRRSWAARLWSRNAALLLGRNTLVSAAMFLLGLAALWLLVEYGGADTLKATAVTFLLSTTLHYLLGRAWIYRGTDRRPLPGYGLFLANALLGLALTLLLMHVLLRWTPLHYLVARVLVSLIAGLLMFLSNAIFNFKRL